MRRRAITTKPAAPDAEAVNRRLPTNRASDGEGPAVPGVDDLDRSFGDLLDADRRDRAVRSRRDSEVRRLLEEDTATFCGVLLDLGEQRVSVLVEHVGGRVAGKVVGLGQDHVLIEARGTRGRSVVRLEAIQVVTPETGMASVPSRGRRSVQSTGTIRDVLADATAERMPLRVHVAGRSEALAGIPKSVGEDVLDIGNAATTGRALVRLATVVRVDLET